MPVNEETAFDTVEERTTSEPATLFGGGSSVMDSWATEQDIKDNLLAGSYTNNSQFSIPPHVYEGAGSTAFDAVEVRQPANPDLGAVVGSGGSDLAAYESTESIVDTLLAGTFTNMSSYPIPPAIYEGTGATAWNTAQEVEISGSESGVEVGYNFLGTRVSGTARLVDPETGDTFAVEGATVKTTRGERTFEAPADRQTGEFELPIGEGGEYKIEATHPLLADDAKTMTFQDGESVSGQTFLLKAPSGFAGIARRSLGGKS